jgi:hypothetical protein
MSIMMHKKTIFQSNLIRKDPRGSEYCIIQGIERNIAQTIQFVAVIVASGSQDNVVKVLLSPGNVSNWNW